MTFVKLCWYKGVLFEHSGCYAGTDECYRRLWENILVQRYTVRALERLCCEISYYRRTGEVGLVQTSTV